MIINVLNTILMQFYFNNWKEIIRGRQIWRHINRWVMVVVIPRIRLKMIWPLNRNHPVFDCCWSLRSHVIYNNKMKIVFTTLWDKDISRSFACPHHLFRNMRIYGLLPRSVSEDLHRTFTVLKYIFLTLQIW